MDDDRNLGYLEILCHAAQLNATATDTISDNLTLLNSSAYANTTGSFDGFRDICHNLDLDLDNQLLRKLQYYLSGITGLIVCILGCIGNGLSISILRGKMFTSSTNVYLLALAISDTFLTAFAMILSLNDIFEEKGIDVYQYYTYPCINPLVNMFQTISIWLMLAFTVDRYIMICHPFNGNKLCNRKRATTVTVCLYIAGLLYNLPKFFEYKTEVLDIHGQKYVAGVRLTHFGGSDFYMKFVHLWSYLICIFVIPCFTLAVLNFQLIVTIKQSKTKGRRLSLGTTCNHRNDTTIMLVAVVVVFLVCQMPALISNTVYASMPDNFIKGGPRYDYLHIIFEITNFLVILNSAINILLYYGFSPKFRKAFILKFLQPCLQKSKLLATTFSRKLSCHQNDTGTSVELCSATMALDIEVGQTYKESPDKNDEADAVFDTIITADETKLITPKDAQTLLQLHHVVGDTDDVSRCSSTSDSVTVANPIHV